MGQTQEGSGLLGDVLEVDQPAAFADDIEEIAVFACGRVALMCS
jgi:hypothetical protein